MCGPCSTRRRPAATANGISNWVCGSSSDTPIIQGGGAATLPPTIRLRIRFHSLLLAASLCAMHAAPSIFPQPRDFQPRDASFRLDDSVAIAVPVEPSNEDLFLA